MDYKTAKVALHTRAWIEIFLGLLIRQKAYVALHTRAWIEIVDVTASKLFNTPSLSIRERGLKFWGQDNTVVYGGSLSIRERGLKLKNFYLI